MEVVQRVMLVLAGGPQCVSSARRQARAVVDGWLADPDQINDIVLLVSELVGNAVLHTGDAQSVALVRGADRVRIEVADRGRLLPSLTSYGPEAHTGRGLALVSALSMDWGTSVQEGGKVVWADVATGGPAQADPDAEPPFSQDGPSGTVPSDGKLHRIVFLQVPVPTYVALQEHNDAVHREVDLLLIGADSGLTAPLPPDLLDAAHQLHERFGGPRSSLRERVVEAVEKGDTVVDLEGWFSPAAAASSIEYVRLIGQIEDFGERFLFVEPAGSAVRSLRQWFVTEVERQLGGHAPSPAPSGLPD
jgi:anti-sigma regulatory factor (Ser/Thr protein kinase)